MKLNAFVEQLGGHDSLAEQFRTACAANAVRGAALALACEDDGLTITFGQDLGEQAFAPTTRVEVNCVVKLFASALMAALIRGNQLGLEDEVRRHLELGPSAPDGFLRGISIRQLLSHTDGIGQRGIDSVPVTQSGFIDLAALASLIRSDELSFEPGRYCSEGPCGFALLGAVVERYSGRSFADTLRHELLSHLVRHGADGGDRARLPPVDDGPVCPANGNGLALSAVELAQFLRLHLSPQAFDLPLRRRVDSFSFLFEPQSRYPGWAPSTTGCALGWKTFEGGWVGHNGIRDAQTVLVRLHPGKRVALAFVCLGHAPAAYASLGRALGQHLPDLSAQQAPPLLTDEEWGDTDTARFARSFGNRSRRIRVSRASPGMLQVATSVRLGSQVPLTGSGILVPARGNSFFVRQPNTSGVFFLQYLRSGDGADFDLLWDIKTLWKHFPDD